MNFYKIKAMEYEKTFARKAKNGMQLFTGKGKLNYISKITPKFYHFVTEKSKKPIAISRQKIIEAIEYFLYRRMVTREQLAKYNQYNSFLMGLLKLIFCQSSQLAWTKKSLSATPLMRLVLKGTRFFFAGLEKSPTDLYKVHQNGGRFTLFSYYNLRNDVHETWLFHLKRVRNMKVLLDSGEYTFHRMRKRLEATRNSLSSLAAGSLSWHNACELIQKIETKLKNPIRVQEYAQFIKKHQSILYDVFNLDRTGDPEESMHNLNFLHRQGIKAIPIWHPQSPEESLEELIKDPRNFDVIGIGGLLSISESERVKVIESLLERYGDHQNFHLLGCSNTQIFKGDVFQCDSTGPLMGRRFQTIITDQGHIKMDKAYPELNWSKEECFAFNIRQLAALEEYKPIEQTELLLPMGLSYESKPIF